VEGERGKKKRERVPPQSHFHVTGTEKRVGNVVGVSES
jgi:hypothetical protein